MLFPGVQIIDYTGPYEVLGTSSGIEGALHMVEKIDGVGAAKSVALNMEYNWQPDSGYARGTFADKYLRKVLGRTGIVFDDGVETTVADTKGDRNSWEKSWTVAGKGLTRKAVMDAARKPSARVGPW